MKVNGIEITKNTHKDVIRAMVHQLIEIACEDSAEELEYYKDFNSKENWHACNTPVSK